MAVDRVKKYSILIFPWIFITALMMLFAASHYIYGDTDNFDVAIILHGLYGNNPYCQVCHPVLCFFIYKLSGVFPKVDLVALYIHASILFAGVATMHCYFKKAKRIHGIILILVMAVYFSFCIDVWNANIMLPGAFLAFCGTVNLYAALEWDKTIWRAFLGTLFYLLGGMLRNEMLILFIPFILLYVVMGLISEYLEGGQNYKAKIKWTLIVFLPFICTYFILSQTSKAYYSTEEYQKASAYSAFRSACEDYPMKDWEDVKDTIDNVTQLEYQAAVTWVLADTDVMSTDLLGRCADAGSETRHDVSQKSGVGDCLREMVGVIKGNENSLLSLFFLMICMIAAALLKAKTSYFRLAAIFAPIGGFIVIFRYTMLGRAPYRVWVAVILAILAVLTMLPEKEENMEVPEILKTLASIALVLSLIFTLKGITFAKPYNVFTGRTGQDEELFKVTYEDNTLYVWGGYSTQELEDGSIAIENSIDGWHNIGKYFIRQGKLPSQDFIDHNIPAGDWCYGMPYFNDQLKKIGAENPAKAMLTRPNTYLANGDDNSFFVDFFLDFMREHYGDNIYYNITETGAYQLVQAE